MSIDLFSRRGIFWRQVFRKAIEPTEDVDDSQDADSKIVRLQIIDVLISVFDAFWEHPKCRDDIKAAFQERVQMDSFNCSCDSFVLAPGYEYERITVVSCFCNDGAARPFSV